jgi:hypothetical protein
MPLNRSRNGRHRPAWFNFGYPQAQALLAPVYAWFSEGFDSADLLAAKALLDRLHDVPGDTAGD